MMEGSAVRVERRSNRKPTMAGNPNDDALMPFDLVEKRAGDDFARELLDWSLHKVMEAKMGGGIAGAAKGLRTPEERGNLRNGYRRHDRDTRVGTVPPISRSFAKGTACPVSSSRADARKESSRPPSRRFGSAASPCAPRTVWSGLLARARGRRARSANLAWRPAGAWDDFRS